MRPEYSRRSLDFHFRTILPVFCIIALIQEVRSDDACLNFLGPVQNAVISSGSCTLSVSTCDRIQSVMFKASYIAKDSSAASMQTLSNITRPPFKFIWNLTDIPNQYNAGIVLIAQATTYSGEIITAKNDGIFLLHHAATPPQYEAIYHAPSGSHAGLKPLAMSNPKTDAQATAYVYWNENALHFRIEVKDPLFYNNIPEANREQLGVEILLDPRSLRQPHLSENSLHFFISITGTTQRIITTPARLENGTFGLVKKNAPCPFKADIAQAYVKGYTIAFALPWADSGHKRQNSFGCNIIAKVLTSSTGLQELAWIQTPVFATYAPFEWGIITLAPKSLFDNRIILWLISCAIGLLAGLAAALVIRAIARKGSSQARFELSEEDKQLYNAVAQVLHAQVTDKNLTLLDFSLNFAATPKKIDRLVRRNSGESFKDHVMRQRIEIAKERLRSSHSSEASIATSCGFASVDEMEKYFKKFCHTTPYKFRSQFQVT